MSAAPQTIEVPSLQIAHSSIDDHCRALAAARTLPYWYHLPASRAFGNYSRPFQDRTGVWWFQVKPGLCWTVDCYGRFDPAMTRPPVSRSFLGYQYMVPDGHPTNSSLVINTVLDVQGFGPQVIQLKRRNGIRKSLKSCTLELLAGRDAETLEGCRSAWNDLTTRTGWRTQSDPATFAESWRRIHELPGVCTIVARDPASGQVAGFLMLKTIGDTTYIDTIASRDEFLKLRVNEAMVFAFLMNVKNIPAIRKAHYAIKSYVTKLEEFKQAMGFVPTAFPAHTVLRGPVALAMRRLAPDKYKRMHGIFDEPPAAPEPAEQD